MSREGEMATGEIQFRWHQAGRRQHVRSCRCQSVTQQLNWAIAFASQEGPALQVLERFGTSHLAGLRLHGCRVVR